MKIQDLIESTVEYDCGDVKRIAHFMKVYAYASYIGRKEGLDEREQEILEAAALLHDIGIHNAEQFHGSAAGMFQELEGPEVAADILSGLGADSDMIDRVCSIVGRHHTYSGIDSVELRILIEADFLVNLEEENADCAAVKAAKEKIFRSPSALKLLDEMFEKEYISPVK